MSAVWVDLALCLLSPWKARGKAERVRVAGAAVTSHPHLNLNAGSVVSGACGLYCLPNGFNIHILYFARRYTISGPSCDTSPLKAVHYEVDYTLQFREAINQSGLPLVFFAVYFKTSVIPGQ